MSDHRGIIPATEMPPPPTRSANAFGPGGMYSGDRGTAFFRPGTGEQWFVVLIALTDHTGATWLDGVGPFGSPVEAQDAMNRIKTFADGHLPFVGNITVNVLKPESQLMAHLADVLKGA